MIMREGWGGTRHEGWADMNGGKAVIEGVGG